MVIYIEVMGKTVLNVPQHIHARYYAVNELSQAFLVVGDWRWFFFLEGVVEKEGRRNGCKMVGIIYLTFQKSVLIGICQERP